MYASDTWGISGPDFLVYYVMAAVAAFIVDIVARRVLTHRLVHAQRRPKMLTAPEIAILFSDQRAVVAAMAELRAAGSIDSAAKTIQPPGPGTVDPFSSELYDRMAKRKLRDVRRITAEASVLLRQLRERLVARGMLTGPEYRHQVRLAALPLAAVLLLGLARLGFGLAADHPVGWLILLLIIVTVVLLLTLRTGRRTHLGTLEARVQMRRALRQRRTRGGRNDDAALATAALGASALWMYDPGLAGASGVSPSSDSSSFSSGSSSCGSGSSSCSSGSSSCGSSSSSCGGSSGCGG